MSPVKNLPTWHSVPARTQTTPILPVQKLISRNVLGRTNLLNNKLIPNLNKHCKFICIEMKNSIALSWNELDPKLSDEEKYAELVKLVYQSSLMQIGLSLFEEAEDECYYAELYDCKVRALNYATQDLHFFLDYHQGKTMANEGFDFDEWVYFGIPYRNKDQIEAFAKQYVKFDTDDYYGLYDDQFNVNMERKYLGAWEEQIYNWIRNPRPLHVLWEQPWERRHRLQPRPKPVVGDKMILRFSSAMLLIGEMYVLQHLRNAFPSVWVHCNRNMHDWPDMVATKVSLEEKKLLARSEDKHEDIFQMHGAGQIFQAIVNAGKPVICYDSLPTLMVLYENLYRYLPPTLAEFSKEINRILPEVIDIKQLFPVFEKEYPEVALPSLHKQLDNMYDRLHNFTTKNMFPRQIHISGQGIITKKVIGGFKRDKRTFEADVGFLRRESLKDEAELKYREQAPYQSFKIGSSYLYMEEMLAEKGKDTREFVQHPSKNWLQYQSSSHASNVAYYSYRIFFATAIATISYCIFLKMRVKS